MKQMIAAAMAQSATEINRIETAKTFRRQKNDRRINPKWELNKFGVPIICDKCGWKGHKTKDCWGLIRCVNCNERGHAITICPKLTTTTKPKNE